MKLMIELIGLKAIVWTEFEYATLWALLQGIAGFIDGILEIFPEDGSVPTPESPIIGPYDLGEAFGGYIRDCVKDE